MKQSLAGKLLCNLRVLVRRFPFSALSTVRTNVLVSDLDPEKGQVMAEQISGMGVQSHFVRADVGNPNECETLVNEAVDQFGRLDIACNNAGIGGKQPSTKKAPDKNLQNSRLRMAK